MGTLTKPKQKKTVAIIDIGSSIVKLIVAQQKNNQIYKLDTLKKPLLLGREVFNTGAISFECMKDLCAILNNYQAVMQEYGVEEFLAIATSAMREAKNKALVLDQIMVKTGITVRICDDSQEKSMIYHEVLLAVYQHNAIAAEKKTLLSHTGTGSTGLCIHENGVITFSQTLSMGSLKIHNMLSGIDDGDAFDEAAEEYLDAVFENVVMPFPSRMIDSLVMTGAEMELIAKLCGCKPENGMYRVSGGSVKQLFRKVKAYSLDQLSRQYGIDEERAERLYSSLAIFYRLMKLTQAEDILIPKIELADAYLRKMLFKGWSEGYAAAMEKSALACAETFARRYGCDPTHYAIVQKHALALFDRLRLRYGFTSRHRTILQAACILHDSGYFVNAKGGCSAALIRNLDLCGLSGEDMKLVAMIANFNELLHPNFESLQPLSFTVEEHLLCSKLTAIFRLANALDKSRKHKLEEIRVKLRGDEIVLAGKCGQNLHLEQWAVDRCAPFFKEAFGLQPVLQIKSTMI